MKKTTSITILALAAVVAFTGCSKKGAKGGPDAGDDIFALSGITDAETGIPLDGTPFDQQNRTAIGNSGIAPVYFGYDSSMLPPAELAKVQQAADFMANDAGVVLIDIGGGTTEIAVISLGGIVVSKSIRVGGDEMDSSIIQYIRRMYNLMIGERTAEEIKINIGTAIITPDKDKAMTIRGRDLLSGLPKTVEVKSSEIREALSDPIFKIVDAVKGTLERTPPELAADIMDHGIMMTGGGALLANLDKLISKETGMPVIIADDALSCVGEGTGRSLENMNLLKRVVMTSKKLRQ